MKAEYYGIKWLKRMDAFLFRFAIRLCYGRLKFLRHRYVDVLDISFEDYQQRFMEIYTQLCEYIDEYEEEFS